MGLVIVIIGFALLTSWIFCQGLALAAKEAEKFSEEWEDFEQETNERDCIEAHIFVDQE